MELAKSLNRLGTESAFSVLAEAKKLEAQGKPMIHLGLGQPDFKTPKHVVEAAKKALDDGHHGYVMSNGIPECRQAVTRWIKKRYNTDIDPERILIMPGGKPTMSYAIQCYGEPGVEIIHPTPAFPIYESMINYTGSTAVPYDLTEDKDLKFDPDKILSLITKKTRLLILINPNNPTGTYLTKIELLELRKKLRQNILLVIDDAYYEYMVNKDYKSGLELFKNKKNVFVLRTFSKIYGLASLRIGWGYGSKDIVKELLKIKPPFNINKIAEMAAVEALKDKSFISKSVKHNLKWAYKIKKALENYKIETNKVSANFLLLDFDNCKYSAIKIKKSLEKKGILLRSLEAYKIKNKLRLTIGNTRENILLLKTLEKIFGK